MPAALKSRAVDLAVSICPEVSGDPRYQTIRTERVIGLVNDDHRLAGDGKITLAMLADDPFVMFPRELAPRFYDTLLAISPGWLRAHDSQ
jgi:DNA-binding transcriptional LysR family regulator